MKDHLLLVLLLIGSFVLPTETDAQLFGQVKGQPVFPLEPTAQNIFKFEQAGLLLEFDADKNQMILKQGGQELIFVKE